jgi:Tol biopolymer transport system component
MPDLVGRYRLDDRLGEGGMGVVYRAWDTVLERVVALKLMIGDTSVDPAARERFLRYARSAAQLTHKNIVTVHDLGEHQGQPYLAMEFLDGEDLQRRLARAEKASVWRKIDIAIEICHGMEFAHAHGVIHRDLKPANIKLRADGTVKVLDFGLAKALDAPLGPSDVSASPTITSPAFTGVGVILGTAAYMSPEQARGKPVDKRADIWAFGVVLFEMLTGTRPFTGHTVTDVLAAVLERPPDFDRVPASVRPLLRRCLEKDATRRLRDIGDAMAFVDEAPVAGGGHVRHLRWAVVVAALAAALGAALWAPWRTTPPPQEPVRTQVNLPENVNAAGRNFALSPDGRKLAFSALGPDRVPRVWVRFMDSLEVRPLPGSETTETPPPFFWSPDSRFIAYSAKGQKVPRVNTVDLTGSPPQTLCDTTGPNLSGGSWNRDGVIIFGSANAGLTRVSASGGATSRVTVLDASRKESRHAFPTFLPDGRHFLYLRTSVQTPENSGVFLGSIDVKPEDQDSRRLVATTISFVYVPSAARSPGYLLIFREGNLSAYAFDEERMAIVGDPVTVQQQVGVYVGSGFFSASHTGVLVYRSSAATQNARVLWYDRQGNLVVLPEQPSGIRALALSPDAARAALVRLDSGSPNGDLWTWDAARFNSTRMTFDPGRAESPVWTPDGLRVIFASTRDGPLNLYRKLANESKQDEVLWKSGEDKTPTSISPDGRFLLYTQTDPRTKKDIWVLSNPNGNPGDRKATPFQRQEFNETEAQFSKEPETGSRWVAYTSDESGRSEVSVRAFPLNPSGDKWPVSKAGGSNPRWRGDGKELFFAAPDGGVMSVDITTESTFQASAPRTLFKVPAGLLPNWDVTADGKRFLVLVPQDAPVPFTVLQNWQAALKR